MEHLDFTLWTLLFPISVAIESRIVIKNNKLKGVHPKHSEKAELSSAFVSIFIWFFVAYLLY